MNAEFELTSHLDDLASMRDYIRAHLRAHAAEYLTEEDLIVIELAVSEAGSNINRHAYGGAEREPVWLEILQNGPELEIRLAYTGLPPDPDSIPPPVFDGTQESGFGVFIMRQCMDVVEYGTDGGNRAYVSMKKRLGGGITRNET